MGRKPQLNLLEGFLDDVARGSTTDKTNLVIEGVVGQGKSCLLRWAEQTADDRGFVVVRTTGIEFERERAFAALSPMLLPFRSRLDELDDPLGRALRAALGWDDGTTNPLATSTAVVDLLALVASDRAPVLVVVDDAHWVDQSSLEALASAALRKGSGVRLGFLFAQRTGSPCLLDGVPISRRVLPGLDRDAAVELLDAEGIVPEVAERCWTRSQGNPLALLEGVRGLSTAQRSGEEPLPPALPAPDHLRATYEQRLRDLPDATQRALAIAALEGDGDDLAVVLAAVTALGGHPDDLMAAERAGVVTIQGGRLRWHHPLLHTAAYELVEGERRRPLQRALAAAASAAGDHDRALWLVSESISGPDETIASQLTELGEQAHQRGAPRAAAQAFEAAVRLSTADAERHRRLYLAAVAWWATGDHARATELLRPVISQVEDLVVRAQMVDVLGTADIWLTGPATAIDELTRHADLIVPHRPDQAVFLLFDAVTAALLGLDTGKADQLAAQALTAAEAAGAPALLFGATAIRTVTRVFDGASGDPTLIDALENLGRIAVSAMAVDALDADMLAGMCVYGLVIADRYPVAETLAREMIGINAATTQMGPRVLAHIALAEVLWRTGRWASSRDELADVLNLQEALGPRELIPATKAVYARVLAGLGDAAACRTMVAAALEVASPLRLHHIAAVAYSAIGLLELGAGRHVAAAEAFDHVAAVAADAREAGWLWWQGDAIEALAGAGRRDDALRSLDTLEAIAKDTGRVWAWGVVERAKGMLRGADDPEDHFARAIERFRAIDAPVEEARTLLARGRHRRSQGLHDAGRRDIAAAQTIFTRPHVRARPWAEQASTALGATTTSLLAQLSPARRRVAVALAAGRSDKQIAKLLHLSPRTVSWHLNEIYREHGLEGGRAELIARVLRELADSPDQPPTR